MSSTKATKSKKQAEVEMKSEPVVETKPDIVENENDNDNEDMEDSKKESFDDILDQFNENQKDIRQKLLVQGQLVVKLRRAHNQEMRKQNAKKKTRKAVVDSGILKPVPLPDEAKYFLTDIGVTIPESGLMRRTELSGEIYTYVKANSLYKPDPSKETGFDKKVIIPDAKLRKLFSLAADKTLDFSSINVNLATIYRKAREMAAGVTTTSAAPVPVAAPKAAAAPAKKGKSANANA